MVFNETTNYDFILPSKSYQRHSETRTANVWDLVHNHPFKKPCLSLLIFSQGKLIKHKAQTGQVDYVDKTIGQLTKVRMPCRL